jgi:hypothetical protein
MGELEREIEREITEREGTHEDPIGGRFFGGARGPDGPRRNQNPSNPAETRPSGETQIRSSMGHRR